MDRRSRSPCRTRDSLGKRKRKHSEKSDRKHSKKSKSSSVFKRKRSKHKYYSSSSSDSIEDSFSESSSSSSCPPSPKHRKHKSKKLKMKKHKKDKKKKKAKETKTNKEPTSGTIGPVVASPAVAPHKSQTSAVADIKAVLAAQSAKVKGPMTKEEYEKQQSVIRRVYDPDTGRHRLVKGDGEIVEEIVSKERHKAINKQATLGDGSSFQAQTRRLL